MFPALLQALPTTTVEAVAVEHRRCLTWLPVLELRPEHLPAGECVRTNCSRYKRAPDSVL